MKSHILKAQCFHLLQTINQIHVDSSSERCPPWFGVSSTAILFGWYQGYFNLDHCKSDVYKSLLQLKIYFWLEIHRFPLLFLFLQNMKKNQPVKLVQVFRLLRWPYFYYLFLYLLIFFTILVFLCALLVNSSSAYPFASLFILFIFRVFFISYRKRKTR